VLYVTNFEKYINGSSKLSLKDRYMPSRTFLLIYKRGIPTMYCFVIFQKGLRSVFGESSQRAWFFRTTSNIYHYIPTNSHKTLTNYIPVLFGRITLSIGENRMKIRSVVFEFIADRQTDRQTRRRTLFYNMYRRDTNRDFLLVLSVWLCIYVAFVCI